MYQQAKCQHIIATVTLRKPTKVMFVWIHLHIIEALVMSTAAPPKTVAFKM